MNKTLYIRKTNSLVEVSYDFGANWNPPAMLIESKKQILELASDKKMSVLVIPDIPNNHEEKCLLILSKATNPLTFDPATIYTLTIEEEINRLGTINLHLSEEEINRILRTAFSLKPEKVYLCLVNALIKARHEISLRNILKSAGFKTYTSIDLFHK